MSMFNDPAAYILEEFELWNLKNIRSPHLDKRRSWHGDCFVFEENGPKTNSVPKNFVWIASSK